MSQEVSLIDAHPQGFLTDPYTLYNHHDLFAEANPGLDDSACGEISHLEIFQIHLEFF